MKKVATYILFITILSIVNSFAQGISLWHWAPKAGTELYNVSDVGLVEPLIEELWSKEWDQDALDMALLAAADTRRSGKNGYFIAQELIKFGADPSFNNSESLKWAVEARDVRMTRLLIDSGARIKRSLFMSPMRDACINGETEIVCMLLEAWVDPDAYSFNHALAWAVKGGNIETVNLFLSFNLDINSLWGNYGMHTAASMWARGICAELIKSDNWEDLVQSELFSLQGSNKWAEILRLLLEHGGDPEAIESYMMRQAVKTGRVDIKLMDLTENSPDFFEYWHALHENKIRYAIYHENSNGQLTSNLCTAAYHGRQQEVTDFINNGATPEDCLGLSLKWAVMGKSNPQVVNTLINEGALIDGNRIESLKIASFYGLEYIVEMMITSGFFNKNEASQALVPAIKGQDPQVVEILIAAGITELSDEVLNFANELFYDKFKEAYRRHNEPGLCMLRQSWEKDEIRAEIETETARAKAVIEALTAN